jgi:hypothetical protein
MGITGLDIINLVAAVFSVVLSGVAIFLSVSFFLSSKKTEKEVAITLQEIKSQTGLLERLTGKWVDRLTKFATTPQPMDATAEKVLELLPTLFDQGNKKTGMVQASENQPLLYNENQNFQATKANIEKLPGKKKK